MSGTPKQLVVAVAAAALALSACTSESTGGKPTSTQGGGNGGAQASTLTGSGGEGQAGTQSATPSSTQKAAPAPAASPDVGTREALGDVKLGALSVDAKSGSPTATVTITNNSSKRSNYVIDLTITTADGNNTLDATIVSAEALEPGKTAKKAAQFRTTQKLPKDAKLTIMGIARLAA